MPDQRPGDEPEYKVYRSRRRLSDRLRPAGDLRSLSERLRRRPARRGGRLEEPGAGPRRVTARRVLRWVAIGVAGWLLVSLLLFMLSAVIQKGVSDRAERALSEGGSMLGGSTILVLGSDQRPEGAPGAVSGVPGRADSIMLLRVGFGSVRRLSILRDSYAEIPGHGGQKINSAYAIGGAALMIETVEGFLGNGLEVNHVVELNFEDFPELIEALGGVDIKVERCIRSQPFEGRVFRLRKGTHRLNGRRALAYARVRKNACNPGEDDSARAKRQQRLMTAIRSRILSVSTFFRLPWVSWRAPETLRSDMSPPALLALFINLTTGGSGEGQVLERAGPGPAAGSLLISPEEKQREARRLLGS
jgi:LCP family protein required for cell wall assembly